MLLRRSVIICLLLSAANLFVFAQTLGFDFVSFDDVQFLVRNPDLRRGLSAEGISWAVTTNFISNWHPITWISFLLDFELYGLDPAGYHATNLLLHAGNTLLLFGLLRAMTGRELPSAFVAGLFAVHPLHVESVAWISERKDVLSTCFALLALRAYVGYARRPGLPRYLLTAVLFALGLAAKQMIVTLPFVFLLLDYWPLDRFAPSSTGSRSPVPPRSSIARLLLEKLPLLALSAAASITIYQIQQYDDPAAYAQAVPLHLRLANAAVSYALYLYKMFWPLELSALYPHPYLPEGGGVPWTAVEVAGSVVLLAALSATLFASRRRYAIVGWLWFLGTLVPVIGLVQVGNQGMADRYTYFPLVGCFVALAWGGEDLSTRLRRTGRLHLTLPLLAVASIAVCMLLSAVQVRVWRDSLALFAHAVELEPRNVPFRYNLGRTLQTRGRIDEAIAHYREVLRINPNHLKTHSNLGVALRDRGQLEAGIRHLRRAVELYPDFADAHSNLGNALAASGDVRAAIRSYRRAIRADPDHAAAHVNLGNVLHARGKSGAALRHYREAVRAAPTSASARYNLASLLAERDRFDEAIEQFRAVLELDPDHARAREKLARSLEARNHARALDDPRSTAAP